MRKVWRSVTVRGSVSDFYKAKYCILSLERKPGGDIAPQGRKEKKVRLCWRVSSLDFSAGHRELMSKLVPFEEF